MCRAITVFIVIFWVAISFAQDRENVPLKYLPIQQVYSNSKPLSSDSIEFSKSGNHLFLLNGRRTIERFNKYSFSEDASMEFGSQADVGRMVVKQLPSGYAYHQYPSKSRGETLELIAASESRLYFYSHSDKSIYSSDHELKNGKRERASSPVFWATSRAFKQENGRRLYIHNTRSGSPDDTVFMIDEGGRETALASRSELKSVDEGIAGVSSNRAAFRDENAFMLVTVEGGNRTKSISQISPERLQSSYPITSFYANNDAWFCLLSRTKDWQSTEIDYYDSKTAEYLGTYTFPAPATTRYEYGTVVRSDASGKLLAFPRDRGALLLRVVDDQFTFFADSMQIPRLALLDETQFALSGDGKQIALHVKNSDDPDGIAIIKISDIEQVMSHRTDAMAGRNSAPGAKSLSSLSIKDVDLEIREGHEPDSVVHILKFDRAKISNVEFSPDDRWLFAGTWPDRRDRQVWLFDAADGDVLDFVSYAENAFSLHRFSVGDHCFSSDSTRLATISEDYISIWDITKKDPVLIQSHSVSEILKEDADDEFDRISEFLFLPTSGPTAASNRLVIRADESTWVVALDNGRLEVVASRQSREMGGNSDKLSFSKDGRSIFSGSDQGVIKEFLIQDGTIKAKTILKVDPWKRSSSRPHFQWFSKPFDWAVIAEAGTYRVCHYRNGKLTDAVPISFEVDGLNQYSSTPQLKINEEVDRDEDARISMIDSNFRTIKTASLVGVRDLNFNHFDLASDGKHAAVIVNDRIWIVRCEPKTNSLSKATLPKAMK
ncbi:WD40 repeat domain-containing protein [Thalassoglobus sp.]|uniref:WD40 repeat domain-containing protein n=1 Tax=Thalassoglobus sp. TaxID=2795869 RepID=UPI003AA8E6AE